VAHAGLSPPLRILNQWMPLQERASSPSPCTRLLIAITPTTDVEAEIPQQLTNTSLELVAWTLMLLILMKAFKVLAASNPPMSERKSPHGAMLPPQEMKTKCWHSPTLADLLPFVLMLPLGTATEEEFILLQTVENLWTTVSKLLAGMSSAALMPGLSVIPGELIGDIADTCMLQWDKMPVELPRNVLHRLLLNFSNKHLFRF